MYMQSSFCLCEESFLEGRPCSGEGLSGVLPGINCGSLPESYIVFWRVVKTE